MIFSGTDSGSFWKMWRTGFYETDLKGNFRFFNHALCRIFGYTASEIKGRNFREFMDAENALYAFTIFNRLYESGEIPSEIIWRIISVKTARRESWKYRSISSSTGSAKKPDFRVWPGTSPRKLPISKNLKLPSNVPTSFTRPAPGLNSDTGPFWNFYPIRSSSLTWTARYPTSTLPSNGSFGWTLKELEGKRIPFVPDSEKERTRAGIKKLFAEKALHGFETRRTTKDGRILDIVVDGAIFYRYAQDNPAGQVITLQGCDRPEAGRTD
jgi:PAS domain S-box-containing protein